MPSDSQYLWSTAHSMMRKPPTIATALSVWISLCAKPAIWAGLVCSVVELVRDRVAVDAAVVVDAVEVRLRHVGAVGEVGARLLGDDRADLDRRPGGLRARLRPALRHVGRRPSRWSSYRRRLRSTSSCRCCCCRTRQPVPTGRPPARATRALAAICPSRRSSSPDPPPPHDYGAEPSVRQAHSCTENEPTRWTRAQSRRPYRLLGSVCTGARAAIVFTCDIRLDAFGSRR